MKISVLTPSFNSGNYIEKAIQSVLVQNYPDVEHIIMDGGSTDATIEILKKYAHLTWVSEKDEGQPDAMNKAFKKSSGDIIVYLNADDYFEENVFSKVIQCFTDKDCDIVVGNLYNRYFNNQNEDITITDYSFSKILYPQRFHFPYNPVSYFYRRYVQEAVGEFPEAEHYAMDYWFLLRAFDRFKVRKIEIPLGTFYRTGFNKTSLNESNVQRLAASYMKEKGTFQYMKYLLHNSRYNLWHAIRYQYWKKPIKYIYYRLFAAKKFSSYRDFEKTGIRNLKNSN